MSTKSCSHTCAFALINQSSLMIDLTGFRTRGNENAALIIQNDRCGQKLKLG